MITMKPKSLIKLFICLYFLSSSSFASADMYKYLTKDGETILTGTRLKGSGNKLLKVFKIKKKGAYKSSYKPKKTIKNKSRKNTLFAKRNKSKKRRHTKNKNRKSSRNLANMVKADGRDNGIIVGCNSSTHLSRQARLYRNTISIYSRIYDVDPELIHAIVRQESCFNEGAHSRVGAIGLMQLMPQTALGLRINDPWNPEHNIQGGIKYISQMMRRFDGNAKLAIAAYNAGPGNVRKYKGIPPFKETRNYVKKVYAEYQRLKTEGIHYSDKIQLASNTITEN